MVRADDGSIEDEYVAPNFIFSRARSQGAQVVQYNHPRAGAEGLTVVGIFNNTYIKAFGIDQYNAELRDLQQRYEDNIKAFEHTMYQLDQSIQRGGYRWTR